MASQDVPSFIIDEPSEPVRISADRATSRFHLPLAPDFEFDASIFQVMGQSRE